MPTPSQVNGSGTLDHESEAHANLAEPKSLRIEDWITVVVMALLALITFANVLVRYFSDSSFAWTEEFSVFLMVLLALVGGCAAVARNAHIRIEFFADRGLPQRRRRLAEFAAASMALLFAVIAVLSVRIVWDEYRYEETSPGIGLPQWWYTVWVPIVSAAITARALGLWHRLRRAPDAFFTDPPAVNDAEEQQP